MMDADSCSTHCTHKWTIRLHLENGIRRQNPRPGTILASDKGGPALREHFATDPVSFLDYAVTADVQKPVQNKFQAMVSRTHLGVILYRLRTTIEPWSRWAGHRLHHQLDQGPEGLDPSRGLRLYLLAGGHVTADRPGH